jgi:single-strand DNA-binding protein
MNIITIAGRLGSDPEVRFTSSGRKVTTLRIAVNIRKSGKEETIWYRVTIWGENFDKMISYLKKGSAVIIVGDLAKPEIFTDREGKAQVSMNITATNIMFSPFGRNDRTDQNQSLSIEKSADDSAESSENEYASFATGQNSQSDPSESKEFSDDEIPF